MLHFYGVIVKFDFLKDEDIYEHKYTHFLIRNKGRCWVLQVLNALETSMLIVSQEFLKYDVMNFIFGVFIFNFSYKEEI